MILKFDECWIPDFEGEYNISGNLSHKRELPEHTRFIGTLSRFKRMSEKVKPKRQILVMLSGPEPHRSILEAKLREELLLLEYSVLMVRGVVEKEQKKEKLSEKIELVNYLKSEELEREIRSSELVICRSGYSSIMDLVTIGKKALLIPTPGQTEQEYLARYLEKQGQFKSTLQDELNLSESIQKAMNNSHKGMSISKTDSLYLDRFLEKC